jgi:mannose-6-phosphate isomerase-like protein (cupin superfamily)
MESSSIIKPPASERLKAGRVKLMPREQVGEHVTEGKEELIVVLEGTASVIVEGRKTAVATGQTCYVGPQKRHNVVNEGNGGLHYIYVVGALQGR